MYREIWVLDNVPVKCIGKIRSYDWERSKRYYLNGGDEGVTRFFIVGDGLKIYLKL